jgi:hypothetical protein
MLLSSDQLERLVDDLDYILPRTRCDTVQLTKSHILGRVRTDGDILLDLVEGMPSSDARFLSVPLETLRSLIAFRHRGVKGAASDESPLLVTVDEE